MLERRIFQQILWKIFILYIKSIQCLNSSVGSHVNFTACSSHRECARRSDFCAFETCLDDRGLTYRCGLCKPCIFCNCDSDSIDGQCPVLRCPDQPSSSVRFLQGSFWNVTDVITSASSSTGNYRCIRLLEVVGGSYSLLQMSVVSNHPADMEVNAPVAVSTVCPHFAFHGSSSGRWRVSIKEVEASVHVTSEGAGRVSGRIRMGQGGSGWVRVGDSAL